MRYCLNTGQWGPTPAEPVSYFMGKVYDKNYDKRKLSWGGDCGNHLHGLYRMESSCVPLADGDGVGGSQRLDYHPVGYGI